MKIIFPILAMLALIGLPVWSQSAQYHVPKYPSAYKRSTKDSGPRPGSTVPENGPASSVFRRAYISPAALRLLVRVECGRTIGRAELIQRAKQVTDPQGKPVQIDWGPVSSARVEFWAVVATTKTVSTVNLIARDGKYQVADKQKTVQEDWHAQKLAVGKKGTACIVESEMDPKGLAKAVNNLLNRQTLLHRRNALSDKTGTED